MFKVNNKHKDNTFNLYRQKLDSSSLQQRSDYQGKIIRPVLALNKVSLFFIEILESKNIIRFDIQCFL